MENLSSTENAQNISSDTASPAMGNSAAGLEQIKGLLKAKDDTSRFVGLALLKSVLDTQAQLREDAALVNSLWEAISPKFLDRLLRATRKDHITRDEAKNMVDIAVGVLHTFAILLPEECRDDKRLAGRIDALVNCLVQSSPESTLSVLQTLLTLVSRPIGALQLLHIKDLTPLTELAPQQPLVLDIIGLAWSTASLDDSSLGTVKASIDVIMPELVVIFKDTDAVIFLAFAAETLSKLPPEVISFDASWLDGLVLLLRKLVTSRPTAAGRSAYTEAAAALLQEFPNKCPDLLFGTTSKSADSKPFSYLFINLILIDIRSSYSTLLSKLNSPEYPLISRRLAAGFDVISSFIGFLVRSLEDSDKLPGSSTLAIPPDLLLKLRKDIAETMSLTIEYLRDRWDASVAGALGLHPEARTGTSATSEGTRLTLTWESMKDDIPHDPLVLASIRTLAIWLREDENENLRSESSGLTDMFIELYKASSTTTLDFKYPVLTALEATLTTENGVDGFLSHDAWTILTEDLESIIRYTTSMNGRQKDIQPHNLVEEASRGIEIVRVLLALIDDYAVIEPREYWMQIVKTAASMKPVHLDSNPAMVVELEIAMIQLATALLNKASPGMRKRYISSMTALAGLSNDLRTRVMGREELIEEDFESALDDVIMELENLR